MSKKNMFQKCLLVLVAVALWVILIPPSTTLAQNHDTANFESEVRELWYGMHFSEAPNNQLLSGPLSDFNHAVREGSHETFDFNLLRTGTGNGFSAVGNGWFTFGGAINNNEVGGSNPRQLRANAPLPINEDSFKVEIDFKTGSNNDARNINLVDMNRGGAIVTTSDYSTNNGNSDPVTTLSHTFAVDEHLAASELPLIAVQANADIRIFAIRIFLVEGSDDNGGENEVDLPRASVNFRSRAGIQQPANSYTSEWAGVTTTGGLDFVLLNNSSNAGAGYFMPNGYNRLLRSENPDGSAFVLQGPFKIEVDFGSDSNQPGNSALIVGDLIPHPAQLGATPLTFEFDESDIGTTGVTRYFEYNGTGAYQLVLYVHRDGTNNLRRTRLYEVNIFDAEEGGEDGGGPEDVGLPHPGPGVSNPDQFPHNANENITWDHSFNRFVLGHQPQMLINGQQRDVTTNLVAPFTSEDMLYVPLSAAQIVLPEAQWTPNQEVITVSYGNRTATAEGRTIGEHLFIPLADILAQLEVGSVGWDYIDNNLVIVTGADVNTADVMYSEMNEQPEAWYGSPNSVAIATHLIYMQRDNGGWPRGIGQGGDIFPENVGAMTAEQVMTVWSERANNDSYFGRGITTNETRFLLRMYEATGIERFGESAFIGLDTILNKQYPSGGWPYNVVGGTYHRGVSFNDDAITMIMHLLLDINNGAFKVIDNDRLARIEVAYELGLQNILDLQIVSSAFEDGIPRRTGWSQLYYQDGIETIETLQPGAIPGVAGSPAWSREFEPPSISGDESVGVIEFLMSIDDPSEEVIEAIHEAVYFFDYIEIKGHQWLYTPDEPGYGQNLIVDPDGRGLWPRFTDIETFDPLFYDRRVPRDAPRDDQPAPEEWLGILSNHLSANATNPTNVMGGTRRNLYRDQAGNLTTDPSGTLDLVESYRNLSRERRNGYYYIRDFAVDLADMYEEWLERMQ